MKSVTVMAGLGVLAAAAFVVFVPSWTGAPRSAEEIGFPQEVLFHDKAELLPSNRAPPPLPAVPAGGPSATEAFKNVKVMTDVSAAEFMRTHQAITAWVSPKEGCAFCHAGTDYASDAMPTKAAARVMLEMTRHLNTDWAGHVAGAGVTCYTCHRGQPVPAQIWFPDAPKPHRPMIGHQDNWQESADTVRKFFPDDGFAEYYLDDQPVVVQSSTVEPSHTIGSWPEATRVYEMMMQMSDGIGVNCGYCHNSRAFADWSQSSPYRWIGYDALRLVRDLNRHFLLQTGDARAADPHVDGRDQDSGAAGPHDGGADRQRAGAVRHVPPGGHQAAERGQHGARLSRAGLGRPRHAACGRGARPRPGLRRSLPWHLAPSATSRTSSTCRMRRSGCSSASSCCWSGTTAGRTSGRATR